MRRKLTCIIDFLHMQEFSLRIIAWLIRGADLPVLGRFIRLSGNFYNRYLIFGQTLIGSFSHYNSSDSHQHEVIDHENAITLVQKEKDFCVIDCMCRKIGKNCDFPLRTCILVGPGAQVRNKANPHLKITAEQAIQLLQSCFDQGLIHNAIYTLGQLVEICNCCRCCCVPILGTRYKIQSLRPSNYIAAGSNNHCRMCGICEEVCPFGAISHGKVDIEKCYGCGLCAYKCPEKAISMRERK